MPCNYKNYPLDWFTRIRPAILKRARHCCEKCGLQNYSIVLQQSRIPMVEGCTYQWAKENLDFYHCLEGGKAIIIVLTIAHKDHFPMNCDPENLLALCQKCHNQMDQKHRAKTRQKNRREALEKSAPSLPFATSLISKL
jgi:hypothetical protein